MTKYSQFVIIWRTVFFCLLPFLFNSATAQQVVINEVMYHAAPAVPENRALEWIELHNRGVTTVNMEGWKLSRGVDFSFPNITLGPDAYLVVCADRQEFLARYPGVTNVVGDWLGLLSNNGEDIQLDDASGEEHDSVPYASEGDWAVRRRTLSDRGFRGWDWYAEHDGLGKTLELISPALENDHGQNWKASAQFDGTPGQRNSVYATDVAPLIVNARHFPPVPASTDPVTVTVSIVNDATAATNVTLFYRTASTISPPAFTNLTMVDNGFTGDGGAGDGVYGAIIPPHANNTVIEFYVQTADSAGNTRTWPTPALAAPDGVGPTGQVVNALFQVDDSRFIGPEQPFYRLILTETERSQLDSLGAGGSADSDAQFNLTFISTDGTGTEVRYSSAVRNRGHGSRNTRPNNLRVNFPNNRPWKGVRAINLNTVTTVAQVVGSALFQKAGLPMANSTAVQVRLNNTPGTGNAAPGNGFYAANEELSQEFVETHFPDDSDGDCYRGIRIETNPSIPADFTFLGNTKGSCLSFPQCYTNLYFKQNNGSEDDWTSIIEVCRVMTQASTEDYVEEIDAVVDIDNWLLYFALNTLGDNNETSLSNGWGDDYAMYRGRRDPRMKLMAYDVDSILSFQGSTPNRAIFRMTANQPQISRFINHPEILARYYATLLRLIQTSFSRDSVSNVISRSVGPYIQPAVFNQMLNFVAARNAYVLSLIPTNLTIVPPNLTVVGGYPRTTAATVSLAGQASVLETRSVRINGQPVTWTPTATPNNWSGSVTLQPGINRVLVQAINAVGQEVDRETIDIWYDTGSITAITNDLVGNTVWTPAGGPYVISNFVTVPAGGVLTIQPGTTIYFERSASMTVRGRLIAQGAETSRIRFSRPPGAVPLVDSWSGLLFIDSPETNSISYADIEFAGDEQSSLLVGNSTLLLSNCTIGGTTETLVEAHNSSMHIKACTFPTLSGSGPGFQDLVRGQGIPASGFFVIEGNHFGLTYGDNDIINFRGGQRPGPILQILNNTFTGATDDVIELNSADAFIEGNIFVNVHREIPGNDTAAAIAAGTFTVGTFAGSPSEVTIVRNLFYDCDYAALAKEGSFLTLVNNTIIAPRFAAVNFAEPSIGTGAPGAGAYMDGVIIWGGEMNFTNVMSPVSLTVERSILSGGDFYAGTGNLSSDPRLVNTANVSVQSIMNDFRLAPGSPAAGTGPNGLDMGALVRSGASISGEPPPTNHLDSATLTIGGPGITHYRYRVNAGAYSATEFPVNTPIQFTGLTNGVYVVQVIGKNDAGVWQPLSSPTASKSWRVENSFSRVVINEVLARNLSAVAVGESYPDVIELYNAGGSTVSLAGMGITDDPTEKFKFIFPAGTELGAGEYLVLYADDEDQHLGFGLAAEGDGVFLFDAAGVPYDAVRFGIQVPDFSIGRLPNGTWMLTRPTFGMPNETQLLGSISTLQINEWLAAPGALYPDDFVELYNPDTLPVSLGGLFLSDAPQGNPMRHQIAPLTFISAAGFSAFVADSDPERGSNHLNFRLSADIGQIALFSPAGGLIDCVLYGPQRSDHSEGRIPSGSSTIGLLGAITLTEPTPGGPNPAVAGANIVTTTNTLLPMLAEWKYERSNTDLGFGWRATDYDDSLWPAGQALLGWETCAGFSCVPFPLNTPYTSFDQSQITFYFRTTFVLDTNLNGFNVSLATVLDDGAVIYLNGAEFRRIRMPQGLIGHFTLPDAPTIDNAGIELFELPQALLRMGTNYVAVEVHNRANPTSSDMVWGMSIQATKTVTNIPATSVIVNEVMANNSSITNAGTNTTDWIELYNPLLGTVHLGGMSLSDDLTQPTRWVFPPGVTIPSGSYLIINCDPDSPPTTNAGPLLNTGFGLDADSDKIYLFDTQARGRALLSSVVFGIQAEDFSIGRFPLASANWLLNQPTPGGANLPQTVGDPSQLRVNEWLANPPGNDPDWFEIYNPSSLPVALGGLFLTDTPDEPDQYEIPPLSFIAGAPNGFLQFFADDPNPSPGANHTNFRLTSSGEWIGIFAEGAVRIDLIQFQGGQERDVSEGRFPDGAAATNRFRGTQTPGASNLLPLENVVVNEVLTHTDPPLEDTIELQNISLASVDVSGWYITDKRNTPRQFRIPNGTVIQPGGFVVFYEHQFNPDGLGRPPSFSLNGSEGDEVYLFPADPAGNLLGYRGGVRFGAAENGVSFGRYLTSVGYDFPALAQTTFGSSNAYPRVGPIVVSEIMYHPPDIGTNDNVIDEFIELRNISGAAVSLFDTNYPTNTWRIRDAVDFNFPGGISLAPGAHLLLVSFDPATNTTQLNAFTSKYNVPGGTLILGPYAGRLSNGDENLELYKPDEPIPPGQPDAGLVPYVEVDRVHYRDGAPWPRAADGNTNGVGASLQRRVNSEYGNDPVNWLAAVPTPGRDNGPPLLTPPSIQSITPASTVSPGTTLILSVTASGTAPLQYQWRYNGLTIPGATSNSLRLVNIRATNVGIYTVLINNTVGATSGVVELSISQPPVITMQPQSRVAALGGSALFSVTVLGAPPLSYQWRRDATDIPGATNATLTLTNIQETDEAAYQVAVTNAYGGVVSDPAALALSAAPAIVEQPQSTNVFVGANVTLNVVASGSPPLRYQWFFNGTPIAGAAAPSLALSNLQTNDTGNYTVLVTNDVGLVLSAPASVIVTVPPRVTVVASDNLASEPGPNTGTFTISRTGGTGRPLTVLFSISGSATPDTDYSALRGPVTIAAGRSSTNIVVQALDDSTQEGNETVVLSITTSSDYVVGSPGSATVSIIDDDNLPPSVTLTNPVEGALYTSPATVLLGATATDPEGALTGVDFFANETNRIGQVTAPPYEIIWSNVLAGTYSLTAVATDQLGGATVSTPVTITVNAPPAVSITSPREGTSFTTPANIPVLVEATDSDGTIAGVEFFDGSTSLGVDNTFPYSILFTNDTLGTHLLTARATDNQGALTVSAPITITITAPIVAFVDMFADRRVLMGYTNFVVGSNSAYTKEPNEPSHENAAGTHSAWISWLAPASGPCTMLTVTNGLSGVSNVFDTVLSVYTGNSLPTLTRIASDDDDEITGSRQSRLTFNAVAGTTYHIAVDGFSSSDRGTFYFRMTLPNPNPTITSQPQSQAVNQGANVTFTVAASGAGPLRYQWQFNTLNINNATNTALSLSNVRGTNDGVYAVVVSNNSGSVTSAPAILTVRVPPTIAAHPQPVVVLPGSNAVFNVSANGTAPFTYQWRFNGASVVGATNNSYSLANAQYTNGGLYSVSVANAAGAALSQPAELIVRPRFIGNALEAAEVLAFTYEGTPNRRYALEAAANVGSWSVLATNTNAAVQAQWRYTNSPTATNRAFRLRYVP